MEVVFFRGEKIAPQLFLHFGWDQHLLLSIDKVIGAGVIDSPCFFHDLGLNFLSDVDIVVLPPNFIFDVISIAVVMAAVGTSFMN